MADQNEQQHIVQKLFQAGVTKIVSRKLGETLRDLNGLAKGMSEADKKAAKLLALEMMRNAFIEFYNKMRKRIENS